MEIALVTSLTDQSTHNVASESELCVNVCVISVDVQPYPASILIILYVMFISNYL